MQELIKEILLNSDTDTGFIGDAIEISEVVVDLIEDGVEFNVGLEELDEMVDNNDILQITKTVCEDCESVHYMVEEVFDDEGYTVPDELDVLFVDSDLIDCVDLEAFGDTKIVELELIYDEDECNCENCTCCEKEIDEDFECEETMGSALADEFLEALEQVDKDNGEEVYNLIADFMQMAYEAGRDDSLAELTDAMEAIKALR